MFYYNVSEKSKFLRSAKNSNYYQTIYLKTTATEIKENDENEAAHQMLKILGLVIGKTEEGKNLLLPTLFHG